jgi:hypothetical protein
VAKPTLPFTPLDEVVGAIMKDVPKDEPAEKVPAWKTGEEIFKPCYPLFMDAHFHVAAHPRPLKTEVTLIEDFGEELDFTKEEHDLRSVPYATVMMSPEASEKRLAKPTFPEPVARVRRAPLVTTYPKVVVSSIRHRRLRAGPP